MRALRIINVTTGEVIEYASYAVNCWLHAPGAGPGYPPQRVGRRHRGRR